jgi:capsular polysaccharide biosynthesis protein
VVGLFGSALHTALVARPGTLVGCVGLLNTTQSEIGALRGHRLAYLTEGFALQGQFTVPEEAFAKFLDVLSPPAAAQLPAAAVAPPPAPVAPALASAPAPVAPAAALPVAPEEPRLDAVAVQRPGFGRARLARYVVAPAAAPLPPGPLLPGTEPFAVASQRALHREPRPAVAHDAACYFARDAVASGAGLLWLEDARVTTPELLSRAAAALPDPAESGPPTRVIEAPCMVIAGPGVGSYAIFMLESLPRLLLARRALHDTGENLRILLDSTAPGWLERMLRGDLGFKDHDVERFAAPGERVLLRQAVLPTLAYRDGGFHPVVNELLTEALGRVELPEVPVATRLFVVRPTVPGAAADAPRGDCSNEPALLALAEARHGFVPVALDALPWRERLARLRLARVVVAAHGVAMHTLLFAGNGVRVGSIGSRGALPAEIGALRRHGVAYLSEGVPPKGPFTLQEERFAAFLDALCDPSAEAAARAA